MQVGISAALYGNKKAAVLQLKGGGFLLGMVLRCFPLPWGEDTEP